MCQVGDGIIPLSSLSSFALHLTEVKAIQGDMIAVEGVAILSGCMKYSGIPSDFDQKVALAALDISR